MNVKERQEGLAQGTDLGPLYSWWRGDPLPPFSSLPDWIVEESDDIASLARLNDLSREEVQARLSKGHRPFVVRQDGQHVAYGWAATERASIGALALSFELSRGDCYLWDFATLPAWRGRGIYPRLLQAILTAKPGNAERFWIGHDAANIASARGIVKAGFRRVGAIRSVAGKHLALAPEGSLERSRAGATLLGLRLPSVETEARREPSH